jgi:hypothetical protein
MKLMVLQGLKQRAISVFQSLVSGDICDQWAGETIVISRRFEEEKTVLIQVDANRLAADRTKSPQNPH